MPFTPGEQKTHEQIHTHEADRAKLEEMKQDIEHPDLLALIDIKLEALERAGDSINQRIDIQEQNIVEQGGEMKKIETELSQLGGTKSIVEKAEAEMGELIESGSREIIFPEDIEERKMVLAELMDSIDTSGFTAKMIHDFKYLKSSLDWRVNNPSFSFYGNDEMLSLFLKQDSGQNVLKYLLITKAGDGRQENQVINTIIQEDPKFLEGNHFNQIAYNLIAKGIRNQTLFQGYVPDTSDELIRFPDSKIDFFHKEHKEKARKMRGGIFSDNDIFSESKDERKKRKALHYQDEGFIVNLEKFTHDANTIDLLSEKQKKEISLIFKDTIQNADYLYSNNSCFIDEIIRVGQKLGIEESEVQECITQGIVNDLKRGNVIHIDLQNELGPIRIMAQEVITNPEKRLEIIQELGVSIARSASTPPGGPRWQGVFDYLEITPSEQEALMDDYLDFSIKPAGSDYRITEIFGRAWQDEEKNNFSQSQKEQAFSSMVPSQRAEILKAYRRAIFDNDQKIASRINFLPFEAGDILMFLQKEKYSSIGIYNFESFSQDIEKTINALQRDLVPENVVREYIFSQPSIPDIKSFLEAGDLGGLNENLAAMTESQKEDFVRAQITDPTLFKLERLEELYFDPNGPALPRLNEELAENIKTKISQYNPLYSNHGRPSELLDLPKFLPKEAKLDFALDEKIQEKYIETYKEEISTTYSHGYRTRPYETAEGLRRFINDPSIEMVILDQLVADGDIVRIQDLLCYLDQAKNIPSSAHHAAKKYLLDYIQEIGGDTSSLNVNAQNDTRELGLELQEVNTRALTRVNPDNLPDEVQLQKMFSVKYRSRSDQLLGTFNLIKHSCDYNFFAKHKDTFVKIDTKLTTLIFGPGKGKIESIETGFDIADMLAYLSLRRELIADENFKNHFDYVEEHFPWMRQMVKLENIQKQTSEDKNNPWIQEFLPMVKGLEQSGIIDYGRDSDAQILIEYVQTFGMKNLPTLSEVFVRVKQAPDVESISLELRERLTNEGIDLDRLYGDSSDKSNMGLIANALEQVYQDTYKTIKQERISDIPKIITSPIAFETFTAVIGKSGFGQGVTKQKALENLLENYQKTPEKFVLAEGYEVFDLSVPERIISSIEQEQAIDQQLEKIFANEDLLLQLSSLDTALQQITTQDRDSQLESIRQSLQSYYRAEVSQARAQIDQESQSNDPNEKKLFGLRKKLDNLEGGEEKVLRTLVSASRSSSLAEIMEILNKQTPDNWDEKKQHMLALSLRDMQIHMPQNFEMLNNINTLKTKDRIATYSDYMINHVKEHYLNKKHDDSCIESDDDQLIKKLKKYWGVARMHDNILLRSNEKINELAKGEIGIKSRTIRAIPSKGIQRVFSGDLGHACTSNQNMALAQGDYEGITNYTLVLDEGSPQERFIGSFLVIETEKDSGEPVLVLRANNPHENIKNMVDTDSLVQGIIDQVDALAKRRGVADVVAPIDGSGGSSSNRSFVSKYYKEHFGSRERVALVNTPDTNFNGYEIWNASGARAVAKVN